MKTSTTGIELIKKYESLHDGDLSLIGLQPKMCPAGIWTEGYGRAMRDDKGKFIKGKLNKTFAYGRISIHNEKEAMAALISDLKSRELLVLQQVEIPLNQNQFDALVSYVYNTGGSSTLFKLINTNSHPAKIKWWFENKYISSNGEVLNGLIKRRKEESNLYFSL